MLRETVKEWTQQWLEEGRQQGRQEGEADLLQEQLEHKFGPLDEGDRLRIRKADRPQLLAWGKRLLTAQTLAEVFGE